MALGYIKYTTSNWVQTFSSLHLKNQPKKLSPILYIVNNLASYSRQKTEINNKQFAANSLKYFNYLLCAFLNIYTSYSPCVPAHFCFTLVVFKHLVFYVYSFLQSLSIPEVLMSRVISHKKLLLIRTQINHYFFLKKIRYPHHSL